MDISGLLLVGKVSSAHGLKGGVNLLSFAEGNQLFSKGAKVFLRKKNKDSFELFEIESSSSKKANTLYIKFKGFTDRNIAEEWKSAEVYVRESDLPEADDGSWYWYQLIGMDVISEDGTFLGVVKDLMRTGSNDILEVEHGGRELMIPFLKSVILKVSLSERRISVSLPEGLDEL